MLSFKPNSKMDQATPTTAEVVKPESGAEKVANTGKSPEIEAMVAAYYEK